jgi:hypothetical protein
MRLPQILISHSFVDQRKPSIAMAAVCFAAIAIDGALRQAFPITRKVYHVVLAHVTVGSP